MAQRGWIAYVVPTGHRRLNEFVGLLVLTTAVLLALSLVSFNPDDPSINVSGNPQFAGKPANFIGIVGSYLADVFFQAWGYSAILIPIFLGIYAFYWLASWPVARFGVRLSGMSLMVFTISTAFAMVPSFPSIRDHVPAGGLFGKMFADTLEASLNPAGAIIVLLAAFFISLFLTTTFSFEWALATLKPRFQFVSAVAGRWAEWRKKPPKEKAPKKQTIVTEKPRPLPERKPLPADAPAPVDEPEETPIAHVSPRPSAPASKRKAAAAAFPSPEFPSTSLLHPPAAAFVIDEAELRDRARSIEEKAREFEVEGNVQQIHPGPVVTTFEFKPEPGVKYSRITSQKRRSH